MITSTQMKKQQSILSTGYTNYNKRLLRYGVFKTQSGDLSADLVQHTFLKTWTYLLKGGKIDMMEAFLFHIMRALITDEYRKKKHTSLDVLLEKGFEPSIDTTSHLIDHIDGEQAIALIGKLPAIYQKVMRLRYVQDLSLTEISLITGQSRNTVAVQAHRGLAKLKILYSKQNQMTASLRRVRRNRP